MKKFQFLTAIILTLFMTNHCFAENIEYIERPRVTPCLQMMALDGESGLQHNKGLSYVTFISKITLEQAAMIVTGLSAIQPELRTVGIGLNSFIILDQIYQAYTKGKLTFFSGSSILLKAPALFSSHGHWVLSSIVGNAFSIFGTLKNRSDASLWQAAHKFVQKIHPGLSEDDHND